MDVLGTKHTQNATVRKRRALVADGKDSAALRAHATHPSLTNDQLERGEQPARWQAPTGCSDLMPASVSVSRLGGSTAQERSFSWLVNAPMRHARGALTRTRRKRKSLLDPYRAHVDQLLAEGV